MLLNACEPTRGRMKSPLLVLCFIIISVIFTWPLILNISTALDNDADAMTGVCALEWLGKNIWTNPSNLFEAPLYFPHRDTLKLGFHTYMVALIFFPLRCLCGDPVAAFNLLYILTLAMDGLAIYLLVYYLTSDSLAGIISGIIFGFCPFRAANFQHIPFMTNYWIVLAFLFIFKSFKTPSIRHGPKLSSLCISLLFYLFQCMSDIITGIYFGIPFFAFIAYRLLASRRQLSWGALGKISICFAILGFCLAILTSPLRSIRSELGAEHIVWDIEGVQELSSPVSSYLATPPGNIIYGRITRGLWLNTRQINFYGAIAYFLAIAGLLSIRKSGKWIIFRIGRWQKKIFPVFTVHLSGNPIVRFFLIIFIVAFLFSLGPSIYLTPGKRLCWGPYMFFGRLIPPIRTLRTLGGLGMVALLSLCILAGFGINRLLDFFKKSNLLGRNLLGTAVILLLMLEYTSYPPTSWGMPFLYVPHSPTGAYQWLMQQADNDPVIELPMPWEPEEVGGAFGLDTAAMYWSICHGRRIVNGQTAFSYPEYKIIVDQMKLFPSRETIDILSFLGVRYVLMQVGRLPRLDWQLELIRQHPEAAYDWVATLSRLDQFGDELVLKARSGADRVYEIIPRRDRYSPAQVEFGKLLPRDGWTVIANANPAEARLAIDGREDTAWSTPYSQTAGTFFQVELGADNEIGSIRMLLRNINECPKNPKIEISSDGDKWQTVSYEGAYLDLIQRLLSDPKEKLFHIAFSPVRARYIRITLTRFDNLYPWSIVELNIHGQD
jgi:hypothetical protein